MGLTKTRHNPQLFKISWVPSNEINYKINIALLIELIILCRLYWWGHNYIDGIGYSRCVY